MTVSTSRLWLLVVREGRGGTALGCGVGVAVARGCGVAEERSVVALRAILSVYTSFGEMRCPEWWM